MCIEYTPLPVVPAIMFDPRLPLARQPHQSRDEPQGEWRRDKDDIRDGKADLPGVKELAEGVEVGGGVQGEEDDI